MGIETSAANKKVKKSLELAKDNDNPSPIPSPKPLGNTNSRGKKGRRRHQKRAMLPVQRLYDTCKEVFTTGVAGIVPSPDKIEKLRAVLDDITAADVGLNPDMPYFRTTVAGGITAAIRYLHLDECDEFSIGIFCLPPSAVIPLHNHPGMTVFSKLLFGTMHIKSYDWVVDVPRTSSVVNPSEVKQSEVQQLEGNHPEVQQSEVKQSDVPEVNNSEVPQPKVEKLEVIQQPEPKQPEVIPQPELKQPDVSQAHVKQYEVQQPRVRLAKLKVNSEFTAPCDASILYPSEGGNMHCFTGLTACAVLDVLGPPYCDAEGRHCQYYYDFPYANFSVDGVSVFKEERESYAWLQERDFPEDLVVVGEMYAGPKIVKK